MAGLDGVYHRDLSHPEAKSPSSVSSSPGFRNPNPSYPSISETHTLDVRQGPHGVMSGSRSLGQMPATCPKEETDRYAGLSLGMVGLVAENVISHPFLVLRKQCQVNNAALRCHRTPLTLVPVLINLNRSQGVSVLWKGIGSSLLVKGLTLGVEDFTSKFTPWPKEIYAECSLKMIGQHLLLKATSLAVLTPFYSASLVEMVQSDIASDSPGILDVFREGFMRMSFWSGHHSGRMLPIWILMPHTVIHGVSHYILYTIAKGLSRTIMGKVHKRRQEQKGAIFKENCTSMPGLIQYREQMSSLIGHVVASSILYPFETILHRLHMQGCRTIIDNLDNGIEVMPIMTRYEGFLDCFSTIVYEEGFSGLFKGFGAMILQFSVHFALIRFSATIVNEVTKQFAQDPYQPKLTSNISKPAPSSMIQERKPGNFKLPLGEEEKSKPQVDEEFESQRVSSHNRSAPNLSYNNY